MLYCKWICATIFRTILLLLRCDIHKSYAQYLGRVHCIKVMMPLPHHRKDWGSSLVATVGIGRYNNEMPSSTQNVVNFKKGPILLKFLRP
jgi:hypothetical protein